MSGVPRQRVVGFIPARSGSQRLANKNILPFNGHPLMAYSISTAIQSAVFDAVVCVTDSERYQRVARHYGAEVPFLRPSEISGEKSPDIEWVRWALEQLRVAGREFEAFSILRPTSPFRMPETIQRAWSVFAADPFADSLRAVEKCRHHPGKMWVLNGKRMVPLMPFSANEVPWHSTPYASLPEVYVQNASLEIAWSRVITDTNTISGETILPFVSEGYEGFDINEPEDWLLAERLVGTGGAILPDIKVEPFR